MKRLKELGKSIRDSVNPFKPKKKRNLHTHPFGKGDRWIEEFPDRDRLLK